MLNAMDRPTSVYELRLIREAAMVIRMPVTRENDSVESPQEFVDRPRDLMAVRDG